MEKFDYSPSKWVPFRDEEVLEKVRNIKRKDIAKHHNPDFKIKVVKDSDAGFIRTIDIFYRIKKASDEERKIALILGQPDSSLSNVAYLINKFRVDCRKLYTFNMDEYADEDGNTAPETWSKGFMHAMKKNFYSKLDKDLRPPEDHIQGPTTKNINDYGKMIADLGGADVCYSGSGWTGHIAFIEPGVKGSEFEGNLEEWREMGPKIVTLSPFTIAQNSLHAYFGLSGDLAIVPPRAATIGPAEVIGAKFRIDWNRITIGDITNVSWQRFVTRFIAHGPVTPLVPASILQTLRTDFYITETIAQDIESDWDKEF